MKKGIGPRGLGAPKSAAKMYGKSPAKKTGDPRKDFIKSTSSKKPAVNIIDDPIERVSKVAKNSGKPFGTVAYDAISSNAVQNIPYSKRTFGDVANAAEKNAYKK
jgi:hypothetical protein